MTRRQLRENTFCLLFDREFHPGKEFEEQINLYLENFSDLGISSDLKEEEKEEIRQRAKMVASAAEELDRMIVGQLSGWTLDRMDRVDHILLRLACYEMKMDESVPVSVAINEAVELAKKYGQEKSGAFVNGVLAKLAHEME